MEKVRLLLVSTILIALLILQSTPSVQGQGIDTTRSTTSPTSVVKVFSYREAVRPLSFGLIILFAALGIVFFKNHSTTLDTYLHRSIARLKRSTK